MYPTIKQGSTGEDVKTWQSVLGPPIVVDGIFGPITKAATVQWQQERGIAPTGVVNEETWQAVEKTDGDSSRFDPMRIFIGSVFALTLGLAGTAAYRIVAKAARF